MGLWLGAAVPPGPSLCRHSKQGEAIPLRCLRLVLPSTEKPAGPQRRSPPRRKGTDPWPLGGRRRDPDRHHASHGRPELERALRTLFAVLRQSCEQTRTTNVPSASRSGIHPAGNTLDANNISARRASTTARFIGFLAIDISQRLVACDQCLKLLGCKSTDRHLQK